MGDFKDLVVRYDNPWIRALVQVIPVVGGPIDTLVAETVDEIKKDRARTFFDELASGAQALDEGMAKSEPFLHAYFSTVKAALATRQREKTQYFARLLAAGTRGQIEYGDEHEELLGILDEVTFPELQMIDRLTYLENCQYPRAWYEEQKPETDLEHTIRLWPEFLKYFGETSVEVVRARLARLARTGLYEPLVATAFGYEGGMGRATSLHRRLAALIRPNTSSCVDSPGAVLLELTQFARANTDFKDNRIGEHTATWRVSGTVTRGPDAEGIGSASVALEVVESGGRVTNSVRQRVDLTGARVGTVALEFSERVYSANHRARVRIESVERN